MRERVPIWFGTYSIRNVRNDGLESALVGMSQASLDLGIFQENKLMGGFYTQRGAVYRVVAMDAPIQHSGGVAVFYRPSLRYVVKAIQQFSTNAVGFQMEMGERQWYRVVCYLAPDDTSTIESVVAALKERPRGSELLVTGGINANLEQPKVYPR